MRGQRGPHSVEYEYDLSQWIVWVRVVELFRYLLGEFEKTTDITHPIISVENNIIWNF